MNIGKFYESLKIEGNRGADYLHLSIFVAMPKLKLLAFGFLFFAVLHAEAQYRWDFGVGVGASNYLGEIGGQEETRRDFVFDMKLNRTQWVFGGFGRYKLSQGLSVNLGVNYGRIRANDYNSRNPARVSRNLSFRNDILEVAARLEITLFYDNDVSGRGYYNPDFRMYGFIGAGVMKHNPKARYWGGLDEFNGEWVDLQPLRTEGFEYNLIDFTLPAGLGMYFTHLRHHRFGFEIGYRTTFTDYLDDVSRQYVTDDRLSQEHNQLAREMANRTNAASLRRAEDYAIQYGMDVPNAGSFAPGEKRGDPTNNDGYLFAQFTYSYVIKGQSEFSRRKYGWMKKKSRVRRKSRAKF